jgi:hypothetical protein
MYAGLQWNIILYADGITPGDAFSPDNNRKAWVWYASFLEMGQKLSNEEAWITVAIARTRLPALLCELAVTTALQAHTRRLQPQAMRCRVRAPTPMLLRPRAPRTKYIAKLSGGVSRLTRDLLRGMFLGSKGLADSGVALPIGADGATLVVRMRLCAILGDEDAINGMFFTKGASGICPCGTLCGVTNKQRAQDVANGVVSAPMLDEDIVDISCNDLSRCCLRSDEDVWALCDDLATCPKQDLDERQHATGLKLHAETLLFDIPLRPYVLPASTTHGDAMHILVANGLFNSDVMLFMKWMKSSIGAYFSNVRRFYDDEGWTSTIPQPLSGINETREEHSTKLLKCNASEGLTVYPILRAFVVSVYGTQAAEPQVQAFLFLCLILDEISTLIKGMAGAMAEQAAARLRDLVKRYMAAFGEAYGESKFRFKHHQLLHLPDWVHAMKRLLICFVLERKHFLAKAALQWHKRLRSMSRGGLNGMLLSQLRLLESPGWASQLLDSVPYPEIAASLVAQHARISRSMRWNGAGVQCKNVVFLNYARTYLVRVVACVAYTPSEGSSEEKYGLIVKGGERISSTGTASVWRVNRDCSLYRLVDEPVVQATFFRQLDADVIEVLH